MEKNDLPIFRTRDTFSNMRKDRFIIPQPTTLFICENYFLTQEAQTNTVLKLVDRTPNWLDMDDDEQKEQIKAALVLQTVAEYLRSENTIQKECTMFENGFDKDGNVVLDAFYIKETTTKKKFDEAFQNKKLNQESKKATIFPFKQKGKEEVKNDKEN